MKAKPTTRDLGALAAAAVLGPASMAIGYRVPGLLFGAAAGAYFVECGLVVPLVVLAAQRIRLFVWQIAVASLTLAVLVDNMRLMSVSSHEALSIVYLFWATGTVISLPVPLYVLVRPVSPPRKYAVAAAIIMVAVILWLGVIQITR